MRRGGRGGGVKGRSDVETLLIFSLYFLGGFVVRLAFPETGVLDIVRAAFYLVPLFGRRLYITLGWRWCLTLCFKNWAEVYLNTGRAVK